MSIRKTVTGIACAVGGGVVVVAITGAMLHRSVPNSGPLHAVVRGTASTPSGVLPHAFLKLDTYPDSMAGEHSTSGGAHPDWVSYGPSTNLHVPANSLVTMTIDQYDTGGAVTNPYFAKVHGTVDGTMTVNGKVQRGTSADAVGHTFTIHGAPTDQDPMYVSVPLPAVPDTAPVAKGSDYPKPISVTFSFITHGKGSYVWNCEYPCGDGYYARFGGPMSSSGYMSGTFTVG